MQIGPSTHRDSGPPFGDERVRRVRMHGRPLSAIVIRRVNLTERGEVQSGSEAVTRVQSAGTHLIDPPLVVAVDKDMGAAGPSHDAQA
jgi:hypothetical protein